MIGACDPPASELTTDGSTVHPKHQLYTFTNNCSAFLTERPKTPNHKKMDQIWQFYDLLPTSLITLRSATRIEHLTGLLLVPGRSLD